MFMHTTLLKNGVKRVASSPLYATARRALSTNLPNGVTVSSEAKSGDLATVSVYIDSGARDESASNSGVSNILSKVIFKGYEKEIAALGGDSSAWTSREMTGISMNIGKNDVEKATSLLGSILTTPKFTEGDVTSVAGSTLSWLEDVTVNAHQELLFDHLHSTAFQGTSLANPIVGTEESLPSITSTVVGDFMKANFTGDRVKVAGAGGLTNDALAGGVSKWALPSSGSGAMTTARDEAIFTGSDIRVRYDSYPLGHVCLAFEGVSWKSEMQVPQLLMTHLLGSYSDNSGVNNNGIAPLSRIVAEGGYAQSYNTFSISYKDTGLWGVYGVCKDNMLENFMWNTLYQSMAIVHQLTEEEVARAKESLKTQYSASFSTTQSTADTIGKQLLAFGRVISPEEFAARVDAATLGDVKKCADMIINDQDHALAAAGPLHGLPDYNWIRRRSQWLRY